MLFLLLATADVQTPPLFWNWSDTPVRYTSELEMEVGFPFWFLAKQNDEVRSGKFQLKLALACVADGTKLVEVSCEVEGAELSGEAVDPVKQEMLERVFRGWEETFEASTVTFTVDKLGRVRSVDLDGISRDNTRGAGILEKQRELVIRAIAPLDLQLPRDGDVSESWRQKGSPLAMQLMSTSGTAGGVRLIHEISGVQDELAVITTVGEAVAMTGSAAEAGSSQTVSLMLSGQTLFDPNLGQIVRSEQVLSGLRTAQNTDKVFNSAYLNQRVVLTRVDSFEGLPWL